MHNEDYKNEGALYNQFGKSNHRPFFFFEAGKQTNKQTNKHREITQNIKLYNFHSHIAMKPSAYLLDPPFLAFAFPQRREEEKKTELQRPNGWGKGGKGVIDSIMATARCRAYRGAGS